MAQKIWTKEKMTEPTKTVSSQEYTKDYFLYSTSTSEEFRKTWGEVLNPKHRYALQQAKIEPEMKILDVGCGRGEILIHVAKLGAEAIGIDYAEAAIDVAKKAISKQDKTIQKRIRLVRQDVCQLPFDNGMFDRVFFLDVVEHLIPEEGKKTLNEIRRVLKKEGLLILHTWPNQFGRLGYRYWSWLWIALLTLVKGEKDLPPRELEPSFYDKRIHVNVLNYFTLRKMLKEADFQPRFSLKVEPLKSVSLKDRLLYALYKMKPFSLTWPLNIIFCDHFWVLAKKK